jgi:hypothetical protein
LSVNSSIHFIPGCFLVSSSQVPMWIKAGVVGTDMLVALQTVLLTETTLDSLVIEQVQMPLLRRMTRQKSNVHGG